MGHLGLAALLAAATLPAAGQEAGAVTGRIEGRAFALHEVVGTAGQVLALELASGHPQADVNLFPPGAGPEEGEALFMGAVEGRAFAGVLPETGRCVAQVFLMRAAARRGEAADYTLTSRLGEVVPDLADGLAGGPDVWTVTEDATLRAGPDEGFEALAALPAGTRLGDEGCAMWEGSRRCVVATLGETPREGWVDGAVLVEAPPE